MAKYKKKAGPFTVWLSGDDKLRVEFRTESDGGPAKIAYFVLQYYARMDGKWKTVQRYDTCHGSSAHQHIYYKNKKERRIDLTDDPDEYSTIFNESLRALRKDYESIKNRYFTYV